MLTIQPISEREFHIYGVATDLDFGSMFSLLEGNGLKGNYRAVERYWYRMLRSRSWAGRALNRSMFHRIKERTPLLRPKLRLRYPELQALAVL